ncbi:MAG: Mur ligase family protein [Candidatus Paralactobacillus gallistercoris]|uniref:Lipid II isoglutaminyl synthase (glutamine-hydrolyzing) subunit MurT n=1 Tax=Candidatus Paralactobacillus gallistercoris TaxID=2838724 RepID=A0A948TK31_9LACO|nr:Mur ligase family protein [Candidatus Paralactobacillus gallistercoris]
MSVKSSLATVVGKSSYWFLHTFLKGGSSLPGKLAVKIDPNVLHELGKNYDVILVTGTNGKTLTTSLIVKIMQQTGADVVTNSTGSNMVQGITTAFLAHKNKRSDRKVAVLEVDEANVAPICQYITPKAFVLTNIFRDQMDRYGEIYTTYNKILNGIKLAPSATLIMNGDAPIFSSKELPNPKIYYGFNDQTTDHDLVAAPNTDGVLCPRCNHILHYHFLVYSNLGDYFCPNCGFHRPELNFAVTKLGDRTPTSSQFEIDGYPFEIKIGGLYNIYNTLAAYAVGRFMHIGPKAISQACEYDEKVFGRQEVVNIDGKEVTLILVKNPVGLNQVLDMIELDKDKFSLAFLLNAKYADGIDTSWIWDGNFEKLVNSGKVDHYLAGGERYKDASFRLKVAGVDDKDLTITEGLDHVIDEIKQLPNNHVYVLATYTAVLQLRKLLAEQGYIKNRM